MKHFKYIDEILTEKAEKNRLWEKMIQVKKLDFLQY